MCIRDRFRDGTVFFTDDKKVCWTVKLEEAERSSFLNSISKELEELKNNKNFTVQWRDSPEIICRIYLFNKIAAQESAKEDVPDEEKKLDEYYNAGIHGLARVPQSDLESCNSVTQIRIPSYFIALYSTLLSYDHSKKTEASEALITHSLRCAYAVSLMKRQRTK
eukprot:TRINITY_DN1033_c0_g1_i2.p1 TRINITY_DN1033_c0_g1~~TRINITY_DN1033_c0_g1_i2.p1  ORF type:complete len:165 (+),score=22.07 TRINITY_DN1033_c0_g1_i2:37-531(+)